MWFDNWTGYDLYTLTQNSREWDNRYQRVKDLTIDGMCN